MVLPAAFNPSGVLAFEPLKASILRVGALVLAATWLLGRGRIRLTEVSLAGLGVLAAATLATALSVEPLVSVFGTFDRGTGWLSLAACVVVLFVAMEVCGNPESRERVLAAVALGALLPCLYAIAQRLELDPINWTTRGAPGSSLASPTFLGGFLVLVAPVAAYKAARAAQCGGGLRYAGWLALTLVIGATTLMTTIRGPILGLAAGLVAFGFVARGRVGRVEVLIGAGAIAVGVALAVIVAGGAGVSGLQRFASIARLGDSSVERLTVWRDSVGLPLVDGQRALLGFGPDTQQVSLERAEATMRLTQNQQWDRAHNVVLDAWLSAGLLGVAALAAFALAWWRTAWQAFPTVGRLLPAALLGVLIGHAVEVFFAFETVTSSFVLWMLAGVVASLSSRAFGEVCVRPRALAVICLALMPLAMTPALADALYGAARRTDYASGAGLEERAGGLAPWVEELPRAAGLDRLAAGDRARAEADLNEAARRTPNEPLPWLRLVRFYLQTEDVSNAEAACQESLRTGPFRAAVWDACADVAAHAGRADVAPVRRARADALRQPP